MSDPTDGPAPAPAQAPPPPVEPMALKRRLEKALADRLLDWEKRSDGDPETRKRLREDVLKYAAELAGPAPPPPVRSLAFMAAVAYFDWIMLRFTAGSPGVAESGARQIERAERRFQRAVKTLNAVQRNLPESFTAVQINMAAPSAEAGAHVRPTEKQ